MYSDPTQIRSRVIKVRLSDEEAALVDAYVNYNGGQKAALVRDILLAQAASVLGMHDTANVFQMAAPLRAAV